MVSDDMTWNEVKEKLKNGPVLCKEGVVECFLQYVDDNHSMYIEDNIQMLMDHVVLKGWVDQGSLFVIDWMEKDSVPEYHSCTCDFRTVILVSGCVCGGK